MGAFHAPRYIVNCRFIDVSAGPLSDTFVGGKRRHINRLFVTLRSGTGRTADQLRVLIDSVNSVWDSIIGGGGWEKQLRSMYIKGSIDAAKEGGFHLPLVSDSPSGATGGCVLLLTSSARICRTMGEGQHCPVSNLSCRGRSRLCSARWRN